MRTLFASFLILFVFQSYAHGQQSRILHQPADLNVVSLPDPGMPLPIVASVTGNKRVQNRLRLIASKDGEFEEYVSEKSFLNERDIATYQFSIPSPLAELSYHFVYLNEKNQSVTSPNYLVKRRCIPKSSYKDLELNAEIVGDNRLSALYTQSSALEKEFASYERVLELTRELEVLLNK